ncbi:MAG: hypothetical protein WC120_05170 [Parcubacteria group bacterium]
MNHGDKIVFREDDREIFSACGEDRLHVILKKLQEMGKIKNTNMIGSNPYKQSIITERRFCQDLDDFVIHVGTTEPDNSWYGYRIVEQDILRIVYVPGYTGDEAFIVVYGL